MDTEAGSVPAVIGVSKLLRSITDMGLSLLIKLCIPTEFSFGKI